MKIVHRWNSTQEEIDIMKEAKYSEKEVHSFYICQWRYKEITTDKKSLFTIRVIEKADE